MYINKSNKQEENVCVIGLGFVGLPMSIVISNSRFKNTYFKVYGLEKKTKRGNQIIDDINNGNFNLNCEDKILEKKFYSSWKKKKLIPTFNKDVLNICKTILISVNFENFENKFSNLIEITKNIFTLAQPNSVIIYETTFVPGTFEKILLPLIKKITSKRGLSLNNFYIGYSYERVMPGDNYYNSIYNNFRVFSAINKISKHRIRNFFSKIINIKRFPLTELNTITECEVAKILENSYRATNIAFIDEWTKYSNSLNLNLLRIIHSIKKRNSHKNIMLPGLGVGGYCLTKDPYFIKLSQKLFKIKSNEFPMIDLAMKINSAMPKTSLNFILKKVDLKKIKNILILGLSYKGEVGDARNSQSVTLINLIKKINKKVDLTIHDFYIDKYSEPKILKNLGKFDLILLCTNHKKYSKEKFENLKKNTIIFDLNNVLSDKQILKIQKKSKIYVLGKQNN